MPSVGKLSVITNIKILRSYNLAMANFWFDDQGRVS